MKMDRNEDIANTGGRAAALGKYKVNYIKKYDYYKTGIFFKQAGFTSEGKLTALDIDVYFNGGGTVDLTVWVSLASSIKFSTFLGD